MKIIVLFLLFSSSSFADDNYSQAIGNIEVYKAKEVKTKNDVDSVKRSIIFIYSNWAKDQRK